MSGKSVRLCAVSKHYERGAETVRALQSLDLEVANGDFVAIMGPPGAGKTTLIRLMGALERPTSGSVEICGRRIDTLNEAASRAWFLGNRVGFIRSTYSFGEETVEASAAALLSWNVSADQGRRRAQAALQFVGLSDRASHRAFALPSGEQQLVGLARAIVLNPTILLCDEPTGALNRSQGDRILDRLQAMHEEKGKTIVMMTNDPHAAGRANRILRLSHGALEPEAALEPLAPK